jgi:hypothetical protein
VRAPLAYGVLVSLALAIIASPRAEAYPQFQLSHDQTCTSCHLSPAGGGLLNENGYGVASAISQFGTAPEFMYGALRLPSWLQIGGDLRAAAGEDHTPQNSFAAFPMQADLYVHAAYKGFSIQLEGGARPAQWITNNGTPSVTGRFWSREHYVMWQSDEDGNDGLYVRVGRFMPVFGLRFVEHVDYTRRFGGVPLYGETYAAAVEYIKPEWEAHLTGFVEDPLIDPVVHGNGAAAYVEARPQKGLAVGVEGMIDVYQGNATSRGGITAKYNLESVGVLLQGEGQFVHQQVSGSGAPNQIVAYLMATKELPYGLMLDVGVGHYDEDLAIQGLDRDAVDVNLHWFLTSHAELIWTNRIEGIGIGEKTGGPTGGWSLLQAHYRL